MIRALAPCGNMIDVPTDGTSVASCDMADNRHDGANRSMRACRYRVVVLAGGLVFFAPFVTGWDHL